MVVANGVGEAVCEVGMGCNVEMRRHWRTGLFVAAVLATKIGPILADSDTARVVVVRNESSAISRAVANDYARRRGVANVVSVRCQDAAASPANETISHAVYQQAIEKPLRAFLTSRTTIDFVVLTKGTTQSSDGLLLGGTAALSRPLLADCQLAFRIGLARQRTASYPCDSTDFLRRRPRGAVLG